MTDAVSRDVAASGADDTPTDDPDADTVDLRADTGEQGGWTDRAVDEDHLFHLLRSERRRLALGYLLETGGEPVGMGDLAEAVAAAENGTPAEALGSEARQRAYIPLYQSHLPQLEQAGVVEYDQNRGVVEATPVAEAFEPYLDAAPGAADAGAGARPAPVAAGAVVGGLFSLALTWTLGTTGALLVALLAVAALFGVGLTGWR